MHLFEFVILQYAAEQEGGEGGGLGVNPTTADDVAVWDLALLVALVSTDVPVTTLDLETFNCLVVS